MLILCLFCLHFVSFIAVKIDSKLALHYMGNILLSNLPGQNLKSKMLRF